ncbi:MAG: hypothetical protein DMD49_13580 [Gemmatimonadetes bacterium]|nr:MAG: hypothetical protein DMD49_13580 [Gemmatimonadota bacterium]
MITGFVFSTLIAFSVFRFHSVTTSGDSADSANSSNAGEPGLTGVSGLHASTSAKSAAPTVSLPLMRLIALLL